MNQVWSGILLLIGCYLIGNLDFGYILVKAVKGIDIRTVGSGNAGTTNVMRTQGKSLAAWVFLGDLLKGFICIVLSEYLGFNSWWTAGAGIAVVLGHDYPVFLGFKGGKGVATTIGVFLAFDPFCTVFAFVIGFIVLMTTKIMSIASMTGVCLMPVFMLLLYRFANKPGLFLSIVLAILVVWQHRSNIKRLKEGTESKLSFSSKKE